jgi:hypothetical protein
VTPTVLDCHATVDAIVAGKLSVSRFGDGELRVIEGGGTKTQSRDPELTLRMREILRSSDPRLMVCILDLWSEYEVGCEWASRERTIARFGNEAWVRAYLEPRKAYGCASITRLCNWALGDHEAYWQKVRSAWQDRPVLLCCGSKKGRGSAQGVLSNAARVDVWDLERKTDCWAIYPKIYRECMRWADKNAADDPIVVAALGASASVLSADLCAQGVQCLDIGHMQQSYSRILPKELPEP